MSSPFTCFNRLLPLLLCLAPQAPLPAQPALMDSITRQLEIETDNTQRTDLLIGLCRATLFTHGGEQTKAPVARAKEHVLAIGDSVGLGRVLLFQYMSDFTVEEGIPAEVQAAYELGVSTGDIDLELFAVYHIAEHYLYDKNDLVNTRKWLNKGRRRIRADQNPKNRGNLFKNLALYHEASGDRDSMAYWLAAAENEFRQVGAYVSPTLGRVPSGNWDDGRMNLNQILNYQGNNAAARGNFAVAQKKFAAAMAIARASKVDNAISRTLDNIGQLQIAIGDTEGAIASYAEALKTHKAHQNKLYAAQTAQQIGQLFLLANDPAAAERYYHRSVADAAEILDTIAMVHGQLGLAWSAQRQGDLVAAGQHLSRGETLARRAMDTISQSYLLSERARQTYIAERHEKAIEQYNEAIALHERYGHENDIQTDYLGLARCYLALGQHDKARGVMEKAEELVLRVGTLHKQRETAELFAEVAETLNDLPLAISQHKKIQALNEELYQEEAQKSLRREEVRQNVSDVRQENEALARERELLAQRNRLYLILAASLLLLLLIGGYLFLRLRAARRALADSNDQLQALNATKDRFFGIIAHDLRSPIIALDGVGDQLRFYLDKGRNERAVEMADNVSETTGRLSRLLDQLLSWALLQQGKMPHRPQRLALAEVTEEVMDLFEGTATAKGVALDCRVAGDLQLTADPAGLATMIRNLVSNAIKFTPREGRVNVVAERNKAGQIVVEVSDDGVGMSPTLVASILAGDVGTEQGTAGERGSGLGLRLVQDIAKLHGADLSVESRPGVGSVFRLTFPA